MLDLCHDYYSEHRANLSPLTRLSMTLRKRTIIHYTSYMEDCCTYLSQWGDVPSDQLIAPFVAVQVLQRKIGDAFCYHDISTCDIRGGSAIQFAVDAFAHEIDGLKKSIGLTNRNAILVQHLHFLEAWMCEIALYAELWQSSFPSSRPNQPETSHSVQLSVQRTYLLWKLIAATVSFHDWCLSVENAELLQFPFSWWAELSYVFISQVKTVFLDHEAGLTRKDETSSREHGQSESLEDDFRDAAEKEVMIPHMLNVYVGKVAPMATQFVDDDGDRDMAYNYVVMLKSIQSAYQSRIGAENRPALGQFGTQQNQSSPLQLSDLQVSNTDIQGLMLPAVSINHADLETDDSHISSAGQPSFQFDLAEPRFDDFVWDTMMTDFSFFTPQKGPFL